MEIQNIKLLEELSKNKVKVFIASPYTRGEIDKNMQNQKDISNKLIDLGFCPLPIALCYHQLAIDLPREYNVWIELTANWIQKCDCILRLPGESLGADNELEIAKELNMPIFYEIEELKNYYN